MKRKLIKILISLTITCSIVVALLYIFVAKPLRHFNRMLWGETYTAEEWRNASHKVMSIPFVDKHDVIGILTEYGDETSIPYILKELKKLEEENSKVCTLDHCYEALEDITKQEVKVNNYKNWKQKLEKD